MIRLVNSTREPQYIKKHAHICQASNIYSPEVVYDVNNTKVVKHKRKNDYFSDNVSIDPDNTISNTMTDKLRLLIREYDSVFDPKFSSSNHSLGKFEAVVNMGPVNPPNVKVDYPCTLKIN